MTYSGPYHRDANIRWTPLYPLDQYRDSQDVYKTGHGFPREPLPYERTLSLYGQRTIWGEAGSHGYEDCFQIENTAHPEGRMFLDYYGLSSSASNRARAKFINELRQEQESSIGETIGEWKQSFTMIGSRLKQLYEAYKAVRHGNIRKASRALSAPPPPNWRKAIKEPANLWLEWHFGWSPLFQDIYSAAQVLSKPLPQLQHVSVSSRTRRSQSLTVTVDTGYVKKEISANYSSIVHLGGYAKLVSSSVGLADQLGLINPFGVAWELVPYSFLVDNVVNISAFIASYTDCLGWDLSDVYTTVVRRYENGLLKVYNSTGGPDHYTYGADYTDCFGFHITRTVGGSSLPAWCLSFQNPFRDISVTRAATYCSLLLQQMSDYRRV